MATCFELATPRAAAVEAKDLLMSRVRRAAEGFWADFSQVSCSEAIHQTKATATGKMLLERRSQYDYLVTLQWDGAELAMDESRLVQGKIAKDSAAPLLTTRGFSTMLLVLHPIYSGSFEFTALPDEVWNGRPAHRLRFAHIAGQRSPSVLQVRGRDYPLEWEGELWIETTLAGAVRIKARLKTPLTDVGIQSMETDTTYGPVTFAQPPPLAWMPQEAVIDVFTLRHRWRNIHRFTAYRRFGVDTSVKIADPTENRER